MITDCSDPREVSDFHFLQLKTLRLVKGNEKAPLKTLNIVAAASNYGLLFVGIEGGFKVLKLQAILDLDEGKENKGIEENYTCTVIQSETPVTLALNSSQTILAICVQSASNIVLNFYSVSSFIDLGSAWQPFASTPLASQGVELKDFAWNPAAEGLFAYCLSDGSLHIQELSGTAVKYAATSQTANAVSVCWSPKGKQLVVGKNSGHFTQYKHNLQEVKTVDPPHLEDSPIFVSSICWISTTTFAVVYVASNTPNLFIVSTPKDSPASYVNFYDICLGNNNSPSQKYLMHLEPSWGILICASTDSIEIAVLGDMPNWVQWDLKEDGKALLPGKDGATHAIGMTVMYCAQKQIVISESESYQPMPIIFFVTNNGLLISFHMINAKADAASLVSPPLPFESKKESENERVTLKRSSTAVSPLTHSTPATAINNLGVSSQLVSQPSVNQTAGLNLTFGVSPNSSFPPVEKKDSPALFGNQTVLKDLNKPAVITPTVTRTEQELLPVNKENDMLSNRNSSYMQAIISEIQSFTKELQDMKDLYSNIPNIDSEESMAVVKTFALNLHNFQKDITETMQSLNSDIFILKNVLLESFVMVEEAKSRERRRNDHSYITMLKDRALDPVTAKRLQKMHQHYQYLNTQLQEVSDKLDQDCIHLLSNKRESLKKTSSISSTEAIYKTIVNNQNIIYHLSKKVEVLLKKYEEKKLRNISKDRKWGSYNKRSTQEDLSKLADEFLQVKVTQQEEKEPPKAKKLSSESQSLLKSFLKESNVMTVRPTAVYSPSQSRLLSNAVTFEETSLMDEKERKVSTQESTKESDKKVDAQMIKGSPKSSLSFESSKTQFAVQPCSPVYEAITPPEGNSVSNDTSLSYSHENESRSICHLVPTQTCTANSEGILSSIPTIKNNLNISSKTNESPVISKSSTAQIISPAPSMGFTKSADNFLSSTVSKSAEQLITKPAAGNSIVSSSLSSFQFSGPLEQKVESSGSSFSFPSKVVNVQPIVSSLVTPAIVTEAKTHIPPASLTFGQQDKSVAAKPTIIFSVSTSPTQNTSFTLPFAKPSVISSSSPVVSAPEVKAFSYTDTLPSNTSQLASPSFAFKLPSITDLAEKSTEKNEVPPTSPVSSILSGAGLPSMNLGETNKTVVSPKLLDSSGQIPATSDETKANVIVIKSTSGNTSLDQLTITPIKNSDNNVTSSNSSAFDNFSNLSILKQSVTSSTSDASDPKPASVQSTIVVSSPAVSSASVTSSFSSPLVSSSVSNISQANALNSIPSSTPSSTNLAVSTSFESLSLFGSSTVSTPSVSAADAPNFSTSKTSIVTSSVDVKPAPTLETTKTETPSFFANVTSETPAFSQTTAPPNVAFGQPVTSSAFPSASGGFFSQTPSFGMSTTTSSSELNNQASAFSFGKSSFGQNSGSFGLAKSLFGQNTAPATQTNTASSFSFGQSSSNVFGQGPFFGGLGGKPSDENANKNVFAMNNNAKSSSETNLFGSSGAFGAKTNSFAGSGSFSSGGGSVAQSGFGAFQQTTPQKPAFGSTPSFGGAPTFGSPPAFGAPPTFGTGNSLTASVFGQQQMPNFSNIANASSPTFGSLASQNTTGFGNSPPLGGGFGSSGGFGNTSFGNTSFGGGFGSPGSPPSNSSAFTQWRN